MTKVVSRGETSIDHCNHPTQFTAGKIFFHLSDDFHVDRVPSPYPAPHRYSISGDCESDCDLKQIGLVVFGMASPSQLLFLTKVRGDFEAGRCGAKVDEIHFKTEEARREVDVIAPVALISAAPKQISADRCRRRTLLLSM